MTAVVPANPPFDRSWQLARGTDVLAAMKREVDLHGPFCHAACREATAMAAWELAENVIKYGLDDGVGCVGRVSIALSASGAFIRTTNGANAEGSPVDAITAIDRITSAVSVGALYRQRLRELLGDLEHARTKLGLLRVTFEAGFQLSHRYDAPELEISARRQCSKARSIAEEVVARLR